MLFFSSAGFSRRYATCPQQSLVIVQCSQVKLYTGIPGNAIEKNSVFLRFVFFLWNPVQGFRSQRPSNFCCRPLSFSSMVSGFFCSLFFWNGRSRGELFHRLAMTYSRLAALLFVRLFVGGAGRSARFFVGASCRRSLACFAASLSTLPAGWPSKSTRSAPSRMDLV